MEVMERIKKQIESNPILVYMKGTPQLPQCGFSARVVQVLQACDVNFGYVNIFEDPEIHRNLPRYSSWPTFPQLFINGELIGGCDITLELYQQGELQKLLKEAAPGGDA